MAIPELYDADGNLVDPASLETPNARQMRERIAELEGEAKQVGDLQAQLATMQRNEALRGAGLELDEVRRKAIEAVHQGEWTPDAVQQTAVQLGWAQPPPAQISQEQQQLHQQFNMAATGASVTPPGTEEEWDARLQGAKTEAEFLDLYRQSGRLMNS